MVQFLKLFSLMAAMVLPVFFFSSCDDDDDDDYYVALATVEAPTLSEPFYLGFNDAYFFLKADNGKTLWPSKINSYIARYKTKNQQRALSEFIILSGPQNGYSNYVQLHNFRNVLTKNVDTLNVNTPTDSPIRINNNIRMVDVWLGGGFVNAIVEYWGTPYVVHYLNLVYNETVSGNPNNGKWTLNLSHDSNGDAPYYLYSAIVCFRLPETLPSDITTITIQAPNLNGNMSYRDLTISQSPDKSKVDLKTLSLIDWVE